MFQWASSTFDKLSQTVAPPPTDGAGKFSYCTQRSDEDGAMGAIAEIDPINTVVNGSKGQYPIHMACEYSMKRLIQLLMSQPGASMWVTDAAGNTPMHCAAMSTSPNALDCCKLLVSDYQADVTAKNNAGQTPYDVCTVNSVRQWLLPIQLQAETQHALDNGGVGLPPGIDLGGLRIKNSAMPPPPTSFGGSPSKSAPGSLGAPPTPYVAPPMPQVSAPTATGVAPGPSGADTATTPNAAPPAAPSPYVAPLPAMNQATSHTAVAPAPASMPVQTEAAASGSGYARVGHSSAATFAAAKYRPDGFHSSSSDVRLQQKYGHQQVNRYANIAPPPKSGDSSVGSVGGTAPVSGGGPNPFAGGAALAANRYGSAPPSNQRYVAYGPTATAPAPVSGGGYNMYAPAAPSSTGNVNVFSPPGAAPVPAAVSPYASQPQAAAAPMYGQQPQMQQPGYGQPATQSPAAYTTPAPVSAGGTQQQQPPYEAAAATTPFMPPPPYQSKSYAQPQPQPLPQPQQNQQQYQDPSAVANSPAVVQPGFASPTGSTPASTTTPAMLSPLASPPNLQHSKSAEELFGEDAPTDPPAAETPAPAEQVSTDVGPPVVSPAPKSAEDVFASGSPSEQKDSHPAAPAEPALVPPTAAPEYPSTIPDPPKSAEDIFSEAPPSSDAPVANPEVSVPVPSEQPTMTPDYPAEVPAAPKSAEDIFSEAPPTEAKSQPIDAAPVAEQQHVNVSTQEYPTTIPAAPRSAEDIFSEASPGDQANAISSSEASSTADNLQQTLAPPAASENAEELFSGSAPASIANDQPQQEPFMAPAGQVEPENAFSSTMGEETSEQKQSTTEQPPQESAQEAFAASSSPPFSTTTGSGSSEQPVSSQAPTEVAANLGVQTTAESSSGVEPSSSADADEGSMLEVPLSPRGEQPVAAPAPVAEPAPAAAPGAAGNDLFAAIGMPPPPFASRR